MTARAVRSVGTDACFLRMLEIELTRAGFTVCRGGDVLPDCALVDLDSAAVPSGLPAVGYSRTGQSSPDCAVTLLRPFAISELLAALSRLERPDPAAGDAAPCGLHLDDPSRSVAYGGANLPLMPAEYALLRRLLAADGAPVSRAELLAALPSGSTPTSNLVEVTICTLRRKLEDAFGIRPIRTVRGVGYRCEG